MFRKVAIGITIFIGLTAIFGLLYGYGLSIIRIESNAQNEQVTYNKEEIKFSIQQFLFCKIYEEII